MIRAILFIRQYWLQILIVVVAAVLAVEAIGAIHSYGQRQYQSGRNAVIAEDAIAAAQSRLDAAEHERVAAATGVDLHTTLDIALPKIEVSTSESIQKIQTIYLAAPADPAAVCVRPAGVQAELDAARDRANAAASRSL